MSIPEKRSFHISDVLTILTDRLVSTRHMDGIYDILGFMTDSQPFTHQLPRVSDEVKPFLAAQHPELAKIEVPDFTAETREEQLANVTNWLESIYAIHGTEVLVSRIPSEDHTEVDPLAELAMMRPDAKIIVVSSEDPA